jgi:hypothetical protein
MTVNVSGHARAFLPCMRHLHRTKFSVPQKKIIPKKKAAAKSQHVNSLFQARWTEFAGKPFAPSLPPEKIVKTVQGLAALPAAALAEPPIELWAHTRARRGADCGQQAEVSAFYSGDITIVGVLGQAAVLALLNATAAGECCNKAVQCPTRCPCNYIPQAKPAFYGIDGTHEIGALLQGNAVWNCECRERVEE